MRDDGTGWLVRDPLPRTRPDRRAANYYRSAAEDGQGKDGKAIGGIPLASAEAAVVAAVRMAYRVAEAQIDRSARLARRLREAGDHAAGPGSDRQALDATERLVCKAMMALLGWIEAAAAERGSPLKRLAAAQYRLFGALLGLTPPDSRETDATHARDTTSARTQARTSRPVEDAGTEPPRGSVRIQHVGKERRATRVVAWEYTGDAVTHRTIPATFYNVEGRSRRPLAAEIVFGARRSITLRLATSGSIASGRWRAALCEADGLQVGQIEIML
jgi:hypothetical protein